MNKNIKDLVTEAVLNVLNDAQQWNDLFGFFDMVPPLKNKIKIDGKEDNDNIHQIPIKHKENIPLFKKSGDNTFSIDKKEN